MDYLEEEKNLKLECEIYFAHVYNLGFGQETSAYVEAI